MRQTQTDRPIRVANVMPYGVEFLETKEVGLLATLKIEIASGARILVIFK